MNTTTRAGAVMLIAFFACGCASDPNKVMAAWQGHNVSEVIASWGPPSTVLDDPPGRIMSWTWQRSIIMPGTFNTAYVAQPGIYNGGYYQTTGTPGMATTYTASRTFWVDRGGIITRWAWQGQ